ncbi:mercuric reductase [soil metagenome]
MNEQKPQKFDAIILGVGQAGNPLAMELASKNWKIAVVERHKVGGSCINYGCTPSKTMMASAYAAHLIRRAGEYGISAELKEVNLPLVVKRKNEIVEQFRNGIEKSLEGEENIKLIYGEASFLSTHQISVSSTDGGTSIIESEKIFINCGGQPDIPDIKGVHSINYLNSTSIMDLKELPKHLLVIGGNYLGLEFAQMFKRFGCQVSILEKNDQLLSREDEDIAKEVEKILKEEGLNIYLNAEIKEIKNNEEESEILFSIENEIKSLKGSHILMAAGRKPNTSSLQLDRAGVETDEKGYIKVNEKLETNVAGVYAMGDINGGPAFTHISYNDFRIIKANLFSKEKSRNTKERMVPYTMFTNPELGRVGISEKQAREKGIKIKIAKMPMNKAARAIEKGETKGLMKVIIEEDSDKILGASILGTEGGEILAVLQIAMMGNLPYTELRDGVFSHPTLAESLNNLFMAIE